MSALPSSNTETITLTGANFSPITNSCNFDNNGTCIFKDQDCHYFIAPINLPDGVNIEKITFYWKDSNIENDASIRLKSSSLDGTDDTLVTINSDGYENEPSSSFEIVSIPIDNSQFGYYLYLTMDTEHYVEVYGVRIEYSVPNLLFLPFIRRSDLL